MMMDDTNASAMENEKTEESDTSHVSGTQDGEPPVKKSKLERSDTEVLPAEEGIENPRDFERSDSCRTEVYNLGEGLILEDISDPEDSSDLQPSQQWQQSGENQLHTNLQIVNNITQMCDKLRNERRMNDRKVTTNLGLDNAANGGKESVDVLHRNGASQDDIDSIFQDIDKVKAAVFVVQPQALISSDEIFSSLEKHAEDDDRVEIVRDLILGRLESESNPELRSLESSKQYFDEEDEVLSDCENVLEVLPNVDPYEVYKLMNKYRYSKNRALKVIEILNLKTGVTMDDDFSGDPLYHDMKTVAGMFPRRDKNEIYAYLEAHYHTPNRVQVVCEELLHQEQGSQSLEGNALQDDSAQPDTNSKGSQSQYKGSKITKSNNEESFRSKTGSVKRKKKNHKLKRFKTGSVRVSIEALEQDVKLLLTVFPDGDPEHLYDELKKLSLYPDRVQRLSDAMFENGEYPKLKDRLYKEERAERLRKLQCTELNMEDFIEMFPDPENTFVNRRRTDVYDNYKQHCLIQLKNDFPSLKEQSINNIMQSHNYHYLPSYKDLKDLQDDPDICLDITRAEESMPDIPNEFFYRELLYRRHEDDIIGHIRKLSEERKTLVEDAEKTDSLQTCPICYDEQLLVSEMQSCKKDHKFCEDCVRRGSQSALGQGLLKVKCFNDDCSDEIALSTLQKLIKPGQFSALLRKLQEEEIRKAEIEDLIFCPFCPFGMIMPDVNNKVFQCLNPECKKESCRHCQRPNHVPMSCDEVMKSMDSTGLRVYIETKMTEAMIRHCWRCNRPFFKIDGCNKMSCSCKAAMCYICGKPVTEYDHFDSGKKNSCTLYSDELTLHKEEMEKAALAAMEQYKKEHPNMSEEDLKFDPLSLIRKKVRQKKVKPAKPVKTEEEGATDDKEKEGADDGKEKEGADGKEKAEEESDSEYEEVEINLLTEHYGDGFRYNVEDGDSDEDQMIDNAGASGDDMGNDEFDTEFHAAVKRYEDIHGKPVVSSDEEDKEEEPDEEENNEEETNQDEANQEGENQEGENQEGENQEEENQEEANQEEAKQEEANQEDAKHEEANQEDTKQEEAKQEEANQEDSKQEEANQEDTKQEEANQKDTKQEEVKQEGVNPVDTKQEEAKHEEDNKEDSKQEEANQEDTKQEEANQEDTKQEEVKKEGGNQEGVNQVDSKQEEANQEEAKQEEANQQQDNPADHEENNKEESNEEVGKDDINNDEGIKEEPIPPDVNQQESNKKEGNKESIPVDVTQEESTKEEGRKEYSEQDEGTGENTKVEESNKDEGTTSEDNVGTETSKGKALLEQSKLEDAECGSGNLRDAELDIGKMEGVESEIGNMEGLESDIGNMEGVESDIGKMEGIESDIGVMDGVESGIGNKAGAESNIDNMEGVETDIGNMEGVESDNYCNMEGVESEIDKMEGMESQVGKDVQPTSSSSSSSATQFSQE